MYTQRAQYRTSGRLRAVALLWAVPIVAAQAQSSPFMTGATALQTNILAWLTPIAIILVMVLGAMAMANRLARLRKFGGRCVLGFQSISQVSATYGPAAQTIVENCGTTLILRCSGSEHGGTSQFASRLIGEREVLRRQTSRGRDRGGWFTSGSARRSTTVSRQQVLETAVLAAEIEQLPDLTGYLKTAASPVWLRVSVRRG